VDDNQDMKVRARFTRPKKTENKRPYYVTPVK
jgi:hypothetical protein